MSETIVIVTGGFDPLHSGHIVYFEDAKKLGDKLIVGVNSDEWLVNKKGRPFMPLSERIEIIKNLTVVDEIVTFDDQDNSASGAIRTVLEKFPNNKILFANGGDRTSGNILEMDAFKDQTNVEFAFGVGGDFKKNSSSCLLYTSPSPRDSDSSRMPSSA